LNHLVFAYVGCFEGYPDIELFEKLGDMVTFITCMCKGDIFFLAFRFIADCYAIIGCLHFILYFITPTIYEFTPEVFMVL
jgi:hypothetical protein